MAKTPPFSVCNEFCVGGGGGETTDAKKVKYDNKNSGLKANNVNDAIDEINTKMNDIDTTKDWNQNDPTEADYIKNRPFYEDTLCIANHSETVEEYSVFNPLVPINEGITLVKGERLLLEITVDGETSYDEIERFWTDFLEDDDSTGVCKSGRFYSWYEKDNTIQVQTLADEILQGVSVKIYRPSGVKQIGDKYIPDSIARIADLEELKLKNTASGSLISISDSAEAPLQGMKIFGKTEQFTTTGKNKLPYPYDLSNLNTSGVAFTDNGDGSITAKGTSTSSVNLQLSKKVVFESGKTYQIVSSSTTASMLLTYKVDGSTNYIDSGRITWQDNYELVSVGLKYPSGVTINETVYPIIVEGSTYDGNWEPYTGGIPSPNPDYPQELKSVGNDGSVEQVVIGKNWCDNSRLLRVDGSGNATRVMSGYCIPVKRNTDYILSAINVTTQPLYAVRGVTQEQFVEKLTWAIGFTIGTQITGNSKASFNTGEYDYIVFRTWAENPTYGITDDTEFQLEIGTVATPYEPYKQPQSLTIPTPNGLPGVPVSSDGNYTDENGQQWICDEIDLERGVKVQRVVKKVFDGTERIESNEATNAGQFYITGVTPRGISAIGQLNSHYTGVGGDYGYSSIAPGCSVRGSNFWILDTRLSSVNDLKTFITEQYNAGTPLTQLYRIEPIETPLTEEEIASYKALHTNYPNTTIYNDDGAYSEVKYVADTKNYVDNKIATEVAKLTAAIITE